jgi:hypothetical protein
MSQLQKFENAVLGMGEMHTQSAESSHAVIDGEHHMLSNIQAVCRRPESQLDTGNANLASIPACGANVTPPGFFPPLLPSTLPLVSISQEISQPRGLLAHSGIPMAFAQRNDFVCARAPWVRKLGVVKIRAISAVVTLFLRREEGF